MTAYVQFAEFSKRAGLDLDGTALTLNDDGDERGLVATDTIALTPTTPLVTIPYSLVLTPEKVRQSQSSRSMVGLAGSGLGETPVLAWYLMYHRRLYTASPLYPYIALLPTHYQSLDYWSTADIALLGARHQHYHTRLCASVRSEWIALNRAIGQQCRSLRPCQYDNNDSDRLLPLTLDDQSLMPPLGHSQCCQSNPQSSVPTGVHKAAFTCYFSLAEYQWARATVLTRSCYWSPDYLDQANESKRRKPSNQQTKGKSLRESKQQHSQCLIPFLDFLNHSHTVAAKSAFEPVTRSYQLFVTDRTTMQPPTIQKGSEAFISYGLLNNAATLARYGFIDDSNRQHCLTVTVDDLESFLSAQRKPVRAYNNKEVNDTADTDTDNDRDKYHCLCGRCTIDRSLSHSAARALCTRFTPAQSLQPPSNFQLSLMRSCGLYHCLTAHRIESAEEKECQQPPKSLQSEFEAEMSASADMHTDGDRDSHAGTSQSSMTLSCCSLPWDLITYARIRCLDTTAMKSDDRPVLELSIVHTGSASASNVERRVVRVRRSSESFTDVDFAPCTEKLLNDSAMSAEHDRRSKQWIAAFLAHRLALLTSDNSSMVQSVELLGDGSAKLSAAAQLSLRYHCSNQRLLLSCIQSLTQELSTVVDAESV